MKVFDKDNYPILFNAEIGKDSRGKIGVLVASFSLKTAN